MTKVILVVSSFFARNNYICQGRSNILDYASKKFFIDFRDIDSYDTLYDFIKNISYDEYIMYLENIENYFNSHNSWQFKREGSTKTIVDTVLGGQR